MTLKVFQIGAVPPPYGGVSVHLKRLMQRLLNENLPCELLDVSGIPKKAPNVQCLSWRKAFLTLMRAEPAIVHFHNFSPRKLYLYSLLSIRHRTVLSFHNERFVDEMRRYSPVEQSLFRQFLGNMDAVVVDSQSNFDRASEFGIDPKQLVVIPEFLPPDTGDENSPDLPAEITALRNRYPILIATNAFQLAFHNGEDMYGIDLVIEMTGRIANQFAQDIATVILLPNPDQGAYYQQLRDRIEALQLNQRCILYTKPVPETASLWKISDIVVRATNTDGNSLSILEALWCGTPVIASDCVARPADAQLFTNRDLDSLCETAIGVINKLPAHKSQAQGLSFEDNGKKLIDLYQRLSRIM